MGRVCGRCGIINGECCRDENEDERIGGICGRKGANGECDVIEGDEIRRGRYRMEEWIGGAKRKWKW